MEPVGEVVIQDIPKFDLQFKIGERFKLMQTTVVWIECAAFVLRPGTWNSKFVTYQGRQCIEVQRIA
jgi:hypothetical protein